MPWELTRFHHSGQSHFVTFCCYHCRRLFTTDGLPTFAPPATQAATDLASSLICHYRSLSSMQELRSLIPSSVLLRFGWYR